MNNKIDFVILWVDGNDKDWLKEKSLYQPKNDSIENNGKDRFRDWDNLKYWFRSVEKNAQWVNNIYFITWGHLPSWLNINNPKLKIINHKDFIPKEYLPTYNSNTIELNLFRIKELSDNFVLFNDDTFIMEKVKEKDFFNHNLPVECYSETINDSNKPCELHKHTLLNNIAIINKYYKKRDVYKKHFTKYINLKYGFKDNLSTLLLLRFGSFSMISNKHLPVSLKKNVLEDLWKKEFDTFNNSSLNRFRALSDISQYLVRYWQLVSGEFYPRNSKFGMYFELTNDNRKIINKIKKRKYKVVCFNDSEVLTDFEKSKTVLNNFLDKKFPEKSKFEK